MNMDFTAVLIPVTALFPSSQHPGLRLYLRKRRFKRGPQPCGSFAEDICQHLKSCNCLHRRKVDLQSGISPISRTHLRPKFPEERRLIHKSHISHSTQDIKLISFTNTDMENQVKNGQTKKRNRGLLSCTECHRRKQKCDRAQPCSDCKERGLPNQCRYLTLV